MKITKIKKTKSKVLLYFDSKKIDLFPSVYANYALYLNKDIDESELKKIEEDNIVEGYFIDTTKRLMFSNYSPKKIEEYLMKKGAKKYQISKVIEKLRKYDFLNEHKMVEEIISYCNLKHYGFYRIQKMLRDRKISEIEIAKYEYNSKREYEQGKLQVNNLLIHYKNKNFATLKKLVYSSLIRLGFDEQLSLELVKKFSNSNHTNEINVLKLDYDKCFLKYAKKYVGYELDQMITCYLLSKGYRINDINYVKELKK